jgi:hypothetical protein
MERQAITTVNPRLPHAGSALDAVNMQSRMPRISLQSEDAASDGLLHSRGLGLERVAESRSGPDSQLSGVEQPLDEISRVVELDALTGCNLGERLPLVGLP